MTRGQRRTHLIVWVVLAAALPALLAAALLARPGATDSGAPPAQGRGP